MAGLRKLYIVFSLLIAISFSSCQLKSRTTLYMERGLQFLDNTRKVEGFLSEQLYVEQLGVLRDENAQLTNLILKLRCPVDTGSIVDKKLVLKGRTRAKRNWKEEYWELDFSVETHKGHCYLYAPFRSDYKIIDSLNISLVDTKNISNVSNGLIATRVYTKQE